jgi:conflict system STAND superfamily ATPase/anaphase-promoting complex subunit 4/WD40 domain-containing protein
MSDSLLRNSPFNGLRPYEVADADYFCGREAEIEVLTDSLWSNPYTVVYGPSAIGKSSLLRAGVFHRLQVIAADEAKSLGKARFTSLLLYDWSDIQAKDNLERLLKLSSTADVTHDMFILLDQVDDYFSRILVPPADDPFWHAVISATMSRGQKLNVLIGIRDDALHRLDSLSGLDGRIMQNTYAVEEMNPEQLKQAIEQPVRKYNELHGQTREVSIETGFAETLLSHFSRRQVNAAYRPIVDEPRVPLPILQLILEDIWMAKSRSERGPILLDVASIPDGVVEYSVRSHIERSVSSLGDEARPLLRLILQQIVTSTGRGIEKSEGELVEAARGNLRLQRLIPSALEKLTSNRILRSFRMTGSLGEEQYYEPIHQVVAAEAHAWLREEMSSKLVQSTLTRELAERWGKWASLAIIALMLGGYFYNQHQLQNVTRIEEGYAKMATIVDLALMQARPFLEEATPVLSADVFRFARYLAFKCIAASHPCVEDEMRGIRVRSAYSLSKLSSANQKNMRLRGATALAWDHTGKRLAIGMVSGTTIVADILGSPRDRTWGNDFRRDLSTGDISRVCWSSDNELTVFHYGKAQALVVDATTPKLDLIVPVTIDGTNHGITTADCASSAGSVRMTVATTEGERWFMLHDSAAVERVAPYGRFAGKLTAVALSPDHPLVAGGGGWGGNLIVWDETAQLTRWRTVGLCRSTGWHDAFSRSVWQNYERSLREDSKRSLDYIISTLAWAPDPDDRRRLFVGCGDSDENSASGQFGFAGVFEFPVEDSNKLTTAGSPLLPKTVWKPFRLFRSVIAAAWSPDGKFVAASGSKGELKVLSADGKPVWVGAISGGFARSLAWSPDGTTLAVGSSSGAVILYPMQLTEALDTLIQNRNDAGLTAEECQRFFGSELCPAKMLP